MTFYRALSQIPLLFLIPLFLMGQGETSLFEFGIPSIQNYEPSDYGGHSQVWDIAQDPSGRMFFGNGNGVMIYDGKNWNIVPSSSRGMVRRLGVDEKGRGFCAGAGDFGFLERDELGGFVFRSLTDQLDESTTLPYLREQLILDDDVLFFSSSRILNWDMSEGILEQVESEDNFLHLFSWRGNAYSSLKESKQIMMLSGSDHELIDAPWQLNGGERIRRLIEADEFEILWTTDKLLLVNGEGETILSQEIAHLFEQKYVNDVKLFSNNKIAVGTDDGLVILDLGGEILLWLRESDGLVSRRIHFLMEDMEGNLWVSTDLGISKIRFQVPFRYFDTRKGIPGIINDVIRKGNMLIVSGHEGIYFNTGEDQFQPLFEPNFEAFKIIDMGNELLIASPFGIFSFDYGKRQLDKILPFHAYKVFASRVFPNRVYICSTEGLKSIQWVNGRVSGLRDLSGYVPDFVRFIEEDEEGNLWLGSTLNPLYFLEMDDPEPRVQKFTEKNGLPVSEIKINKIFSQYLFSSLNGIFQYNGSSFSRHPDFLKDTLMVPYILESKSSGRAYLLYGNTPFMSIKAYDLQGDNFLKMKIPELSTFQSSGLWVAREDNEKLIWMATTDGLIAYDQTMKTRPVKPELFLTALTAGDSILIKNWPASWGNIRNQPLQIRPESNFVRADFSCPSYTDEYQNQYRFRLDGLDKEWSEWTTSSGKEYSGLAEGDYILYAQGRNLLGYETAIQKLPFIVFPPWYRATWFLVATSFVVLFTITFFTRYYSRIALKRRVRELELKEKIRVERERISSNLHDHVGAQLTSIISGIKVTEKLESIRQDKGAKKLLESLKDDAEESMSNLRDTIWTLNKEAINLGNFFDEIESDLGKLTQYTDLMLSIENGADLKIPLNPNFAFNLKQVLKEAIHNVIKHAEASEAKVCVQPVDGTKSGFSILIADDGKGFDPEAAIESAGHYGLKNMANRIRKLGGELKIDSRPGDGVKIMIRL